MTKSMNEQLHLASQFLATAGKSFLEHRPDDSHTNLGFNGTAKSLETWDLNENGVKLVFDLPNFQLKWTSKEVLKLDLNSKSHGEVVEWLEKSAIQVEMKKGYAFDLHYDLPFEWNQEFNFFITNQDELTELVRLRFLANEVLDIFLSSSNLQSDIRIWPHHFDTGAFAKLEGSEVAVGLGMAIPDSVVNDHYFYIAGYKGHDTIETTSFEPLTQGTWINTSFKGAILSAAGASANTVVHFLKEALKPYKKLKS